MQVIHISDKSLSKFMSLLESELGVTVSAEEAAFIIEGIEIMISESSENQKLEWESSL